MKMAPVIANKDWEKRYDAITIWHVILTDRGEASIESDARQGCFQPLTHGHLSVAL